MKVKHALVISILALFLGLNGCNKSMKEYTENNIISPVSTQLIRIGKAQLNFGHLLTTSFINTCKISWYSLNRHFNFTQTFRFKKTQHGNTIHLSKIKNQVYAIEIENKFWLQGFEIKLDSKTPFNIHKVLGGITHRKDFKVTTTKEKSIVGFSNSYYLIPPGRLLLCYLVIDKKAQPLFIKNLTFIGTKKRQRSFFRQVFKQFIKYKKHV